MLPCLVIFLVFVGSSGSVHSPETVEAAEFALRQLVGLSDSGIYRTLTLHQITSAHAKKGIFHDNIFLSVELASPHFESGEPVETFEIIVMRDADGIRNVALDSFPKMLDEAVEAFQIESIERRRRAREETLAHIENLVESESNEQTRSERLLTELEDAALEDDARRRASEILLRYTSVG